MSRTGRLLPLLVVAVILFSLLACGVSTTTASIGYIVGTGGDRDANLHKIVYPGQRAITGSYEKIWYVPGNSRNYLINDGTVKNANGAVVGDRATLIVATTKDKTKINVWASAFWMLNQSQEALTKFWDVCFKYKCASERDISGDANFSTPGWNGMLGENFGPALDGAARIAAIEIGDTIWKTHDPKLYQDLAQGMSKNFADVVRARLGYSEDLFCGSQNSYWEDKERPGEGKFYCSPVRIVVERVEKAADQEAGTENILSLNAQRFQSAKELYGDYTGFWLGVLDTIDKCKASGVSCIINIGGSGGSPAVAIPSAAPTPISSPTPVKR